MGVVTKPFAFEGKKRMENAEAALENFIQEVDSIIVIPNQNLFRIADKNTTLKDAFVKADEVLYDGVRKSAGDGHIIPDYFKMMSGGIPGVLQEAEKARVQGIKDRIEVIRQHAGVSEDSTMTKAAKNI